MTSVSKDMYTNKLDGIGKKYNNTYHSNNRSEACWCKVKHTYQA